MTSMSIFLMNKPKRLDHVVAGHGVGTPPTEPRIILSIDADEDGTALLAGEFGAWEEKGRRETPGTEEASSNPACQVGESFREEIRSCGCGL